MVQATFTVATSAARAMTSPNYLGTVRRRKCGKLASQLSALSQYVDRDDFNTFVFPVADEIRQLTKELMLNEKAEGNACAVLHRLRNCFMDGGAARFKRALARDAVVNVLRRLAEEKDIEPEIVRSSFRDLLKAGLRPGLPVHFSPEERSANAQDEILS